MQCAVQGLFGRDTGMVCAAGVSGEHEREVAGKCGQHGDTNMCCAEHSRSDHLL